MNKLWQNNIVFGFAVVFVVFLILLSRFWQLGSLPPGIHIDEVSFGYEAQSLFETGKDTWGQSWPLYFKGFGEYKAPGVIYSYLALIPFFGHISTTITRLPSAFSGIITIIFFVLTAKTISPKLGKWQLLLVGTVFAFSPWHFNMSRVYYETSAGLMFIAAGIYYGFRAVTNSRFRDWLLTIILFGISGYYYSSYRYIGILLLFITYWIFTHWKINFKIILVSVVSFVLISTGWLPFIISNKGLSRLIQFNSQQKFGDSLAINEIREYCYLAFNRQATPTKLCYVLWNKPVMQLIDSLHTFTNFISTSYLFSMAPTEYGHDDSYGAFIPVLLPLYFLGILSLFGTKKNNESIYVVAIILIGYLPATVIGESGMHRVMVGCYGISLLLMYGYDYLLSKVHNFHAELAISLITIPLISLFIIQAQAHYFLVFTRNSDTVWRSDITDVYMYAKNNSQGYDKVINAANNLSNMVTPLYAGFYGDLTAQEIQNSGVFSEPDKMGWSFLYSEGKYEYFGSGLNALICKQIAISKPEKILVITDPQPKYRSLRLFASTTWNGVHTLSEVYSIQDIIQFEQSQKTDLNAFCKGVMK